jgi:MFS family permease
MTTATAHRATYRSVFAVGEFRVLFAGMLMFVLGFEFEILGLSVLVYARTGSGFLAAVAFSMGFLPQAADGAFLSSLADHLPPRIVIVVGLLARAAPGLVIGLWPALPVAGMLALVAATAVAIPVFLAGTSGLLPDVLSGDRYILGRSVFGLTGSGAQIAGLAIGGAILTAVPVRWLLLLAGGSLTAAAVIMRLGLRTRAARATRGAQAGLCGQRCTPPLPATSSCSPPRGCAACCSRASAQRGGSAAGSRAVRDAAR